MAANLSIDNVSHHQGYLDKANFPPLDKLVDYSYLNAARRELGMPAVKQIGQ